MLWTSLCLLGSQVTLHSYVLHVQDGLSGDVAALKRAAAASGLNPEDTLKQLGLPALTNPEAAARLHALGVPSGMLNGRGPQAIMPSFHEQLLAAAAAQRPEAQGVGLLR
jgi:hypothetical protein